MSVAYAEGQKKQTKKQPGYKETKLFWSKIWEYNAKKEWRKSMQNNCIDLKEAPRCLIEEITKSNTQEKY